MGFLTWLYGAIEATVGALVRGIVWLPAKIQRRRHAREGAANK